MTRKQRAQWWRELARDYENRAERVRWFPEGTQVSMCQSVRRSFPYLTVARLDCLGDIKTIRQFTDDYWYSLGDKGFDLRALACCLIATLIESGDL